MAGASATKTGLTGVDQPGKSAKFYFFSIHPRGFAMTLVASTVLLVTLALLNDVIWWYPIAFTSLLHLAYLATRMGMIAVKTVDSKPVITVRSLRVGVLLKGPYTYQAWWSYDYGVNSDSAEGEDQNIGSRANDILVILNLRSPQGGSLCFVERIAFDTRFPNEVPHSEAGLRPCEVVIRVQRSDRLLHFFQRHLDPTEFVISTD